MLRCFNLCHTKLKVNHLNLCSNKYATWQNQNRQNWSNFSTVQCIPKKIEYRIVARYTATDSNSRKTPNEKQNIVEVTRKERLKKAVKEYGTTVIVFHVCISLISLGICYVIVSAGLDVEYALRYIGFSEITINKVSGENAQLLAAFMLHEVFAPLRVLITACTVPILVPHLRKLGLFQYMGLDVEAFFTKMGFTEDVTTKLVTKTGTFVAAYAFHKIFMPVRISVTLASAPFIVKYLRNIGWLKKLPTKEMRQIKSKNGPKK